jgi:signal recognition particle subunit SRP54
MGEANVGLDLAAQPPAVILMAGLQGSGKTTTTGKLALRLNKVERKKVLVASLDTRRPAAMEQLAMLAAKLGGYDVLILDTAGRTTLDEAMMSEAAEIARIATPSETILVADSLTGLDAVRTAKAFHVRLPLTGLILTRADGDGRGGAALSMRHVTGLPIKFLGAGEKIDALDVFVARRVAGRILGQGDVVALVEKAAQDLDVAEAERMAKKLAKGQFDLNDLSAQLSQMQKMGGMQGIMGLLPGVQKVKKQIAESGIDDSIFRRQQAIISSMTKLERKKPDVLAASRKRRIAAGAGVDVAEVNRLLKQHRQMADMFKAMSKDGGKGMARMAQMMGGGDMSRLKSMGGGKLAQPDPNAAGGQGLPGLPGMPGLGGGGDKPNPLSGLGLPGFNPFKK